MTQASVFSTGFSSSMSLPVALNWRLLPPHLPEAIGVAAGKSLSAAAAEWKRELPGWERPGTSFSPACVVHG